MKFIFILLCVFSSVSFSCSFDTDCDVGSVCIKMENQIDGICVGGLNPGNKNDENPMKNSPAGKNEEYGNTCNFDLDCGVGGKCIKGSGIDGVCM